MEQQESIQATNHYSIIPLSLFEKGICHQQQRKNQYILCVYISVSYSRDGIPCKCQDTARACFSSGARDAGPHHFSSKHLYLFSAYQLYSCIGFIFNLYWHKYTRTCISPGLMYFSNKTQTYP